MAESKRVTDHELLGDKLQVAHSEVMHFGQLTEEELVIEKKLRRKIDSLIMPLVILVYLMNYIDRSVQHPFIGNYKLINSCYQEITMQPPVCKAWRRIFTSSAASIKLASQSSLSPMSSCRFHPIYSSTMSAALLFTWAFSSSLGVLSLL